MELTYLLPLIARESGIIAMLIGYLLMNPKILTRWKDYIISWFFKAPTVKTKRFHRRMNLKSSISRAVDSTEFKCLYHLIMTHLDTNNIPYKLDCMVQEYSELIVRDLIVDDFVINTYTSTEDKTDEEGVVSRIHILTIEISTSTLSNEEFTRFLEKQEKVYKEYKKSIRMKKRGKKIFILTSVKSSGMFYSVYPHETFKTFDNLFFEGKCNFIQHLDDFMNNEQRYNRLGIPYALGIMMYGIPGSGKTSVIKAISNYCKRSVFVIPTKNIKTIEDLTSVFQKEYISEIDDYIYNKERIYVFEEFDCGHWEDIVKSRDEKKPEPKPIEGVVSLVPKEESLTLGEFLEFLDGMLEIRNRMIIFTTNKIETIDPAILRPGRVDIILELNRLNKKDVESFYRLWFQEEIPFDIVKNMTDYTFTQAEIGALFGGGHDRNYIHTLLTRSK